MNDSDAIIRGIVEIADNLGARAVAEGVENERHAINMACNGCRYIQGNYLMKHIPEEDYIDFIHSEEKRISGENGNKIVPA